MVIVVIIVIMVIPFDASVYKRYPSGEGFQRLANCNGQGSFSFWRWSDPKNGNWRVKKEAFLGLSKVPFSWENLEID